MFFFTIKDRAGKTKTFAFPPSLNIIELLRSNLGIVLLRNFGVVGFFIELPGVVILPRIMRRGLTRNDFDDVETIVKRTKYNYLLKHFYFH